MGLLPGKGKSCFGSRHGTAGRQPTDVPDGRGNVGMVYALIRADMNSDAFNCSVCGGLMSRVKVLPSKLAGLMRY